MQGATIAMDREPAAAGTAGAEEVASEGLLGAPGAGAGDRVTSPRTVPAHIQIGLALLKGVLNNHTLSSRTHYPLSHSLDAA